MKAFLLWFAGLVLGVLSGLDRLAIGGKLCPLYAPQGMNIYLSANHVLRKEFKRHAEEVTQRVLQSSLMVHGKEQGGCASGIWRPACTPGSGVPSPGALFQSPKRLQDQKPPSDRSLEGDCNKAPGERTREPGVRGPPNSSGTPEQGRFAYLNLTNIDKDQIAWGFAEKQGGAGVGAGQESVTQGACT